jgi:Glycosyltransferases, probably involved in cell wall biogenesis
MKNISIYKIALFTIAVGKDPIYFNSVRRYFPYNKINFGQDLDVDYYVLTDQDETIKEIVSIHCQSSLWPFTALLKNNLIADYLDASEKWGTYSHIFFIDADFAIGDKYDFFSPEFVLVKPYWNEKIGGGCFYGGKTLHFKTLCRLFYDEIRFIYDHKLSVPRDLDEFYLGFFREQYKEIIHLIEMDGQTNTLIFYDNEDLDEKIRQSGKHLFMQPYKAEGRANKTIITDTSGNKQECIVNITEQYIFNNCTYDFGRLLKLDETHYRIFWSKQPERREVLNTETLKISNQPAGTETRQTSPVISVVMPIYNTHPEYVRESVGSVLQQTFADFEFLIINDGSTETQSIEWLETLQDPRIRLIHNHHDFIDSLNKGIAEARGKYIARMDADDIMLPNRLQKQYDFMEDHTDIDVCGSWVEQFGIINNTISLHTEHNEIVSCLLLNNTIANPSVILRKASVCKNKTDLYKKGYEYAEDYKLWVELAMKGLRFANIPEVLLRYRSWENQVTNIYRETMYQSSFKIQIEYAEWIMKHNIETEKQLDTFFDELIRLCNDKIISIDTLLKTIHVFTS